MKKYVFIGLIIILGIGLFNNSKEEIAFYVDDVLYDDISSFEDIILDDSKCDKEVDVSWNNESKSLELSNLNSKVNCKIYFRKMSIEEKIIASLDTSGKCPSLNRDGTVNVSGKEEENSLVCKSMDDYGTSYYYRGNVSNNYVYFGKYYWRILRINGDGSIRIVYDGTSIHENSEESEDKTIGSTAFNTSTNDNAYIGYMYGTSGASSYLDAHSNKFDSILKTYIDNWYIKNFKDKEEEKYIVDNVFCNDRSFSTSNTGTGYALSNTSYRWDSFDTSRVSLKCQNKNDRFTVRDTTIGNGALTYPIAILTTDEIVLAGGHKDINKTYYLHTGLVDSWTLSPRFYRNGNANYRRLRNDGVADSTYTLDSVNYVRPVINLKKDSLKSGDGTINLPYLVG